MAATTICSGGGGHRHRRSMPGRAAATTSATSPTPSGTGHRLQLCRRHRRRQRRRGPRRSDQHRDADLRRRTLDLGQPVQLFDGGGQLVGTFTTIQAAVDAASNGYSIASRPAPMPSSSTSTRTSPSPARTRASPARRHPRRRGGDRRRLLHPRRRSDARRPHGARRRNARRQPGRIYVESDNVTVTNVILQGDGTAGTGILTPYNGGVTGLELSDSLIDRLDQRHLFQPDHPVHRHRQQLRRQRRRAHRRRLGRGHLDLRQRLHQQQLRPCRLRRARRGRGCRRLFRRGQQFRRADGRPIGIFA